VKKEKDVKETKIKKFKLKDRMISADNSQVTKSDYLHTIMDEEGNVVKYVLKDENRNHNYNPEDVIVEYEP